MYSLPISTYSDYWHATRVWTSYLGGLAILAAGTRYSSLGVTDITGTIHPTYRQASQSLNTNKLGTSVSLLDPRPSLSAQGVLSRGAEVRTNKIEVVYIEIPFNTDYVESDQLLPGKGQIQEKGVNGILRQSIKTFQVDGLIDHQQVQSSFVFKSPKNEVILRNSKSVPKKKVIVQNPQPVAVKGLESPKMNIRKTLNVQSTAYTFTGNKTATGVEPRQGIIAVDPKVIAMGSKLYVEGYGYAIAADTGGAIRGNRIDVFFPTPRQCIDWGRKNIVIYVLNTN